MIYAFCGSVGGVGKSVAAAACVEYLAARGEFAVIETDVNNNLGSYSEGVAKRIWQADVREPAGWLDLATAIADETLPDIVLSFPAGSDTAGHAPILRDVLMHSNREMALCWMLNRSPQSVERFGLAMDAFAETPVRLVAMLNLSFGTQQKFARWNGSKIRKRYGESGVGFPDLDDDVMDATFGANPQVRFSSPTGLSYGHRWELRCWLAETATLFEQIGGAVHA